MEVTSESKEYPAIVAQMLPDACLTQLPDRPEHLMQSSKEITHIIWAAYYSRTPKGKPTCYFNGKVKGVAKVSPTRVPLECVSLIEGDSKPPEKLRDPLGRLDGGLGYNLYTLMQMKDRCISHTMLP